MNFRIAMIAAGSLALAIPCAQAADYAMGAVKTAKSSDGVILTDAKGMTLYVYGKDGKGVSNCYDKCATNWPPLEAAAGAKDEGAFTLVKRKDGTMQWAHNGMPLYHWIKDKAPGDMTGDGVAGVWHVAKD